MLESAWGSVRGGRPAFVLVEGPAGIGKSWLLAAYGQRLPSRAVLVSAPPLLDNLLMAANTMLVEERDPVFLAAARRLAPLGDWPSGQAAAEPPNLERLRLAALSGLERLAHRLGGLCVLLDDVQLWPKEELESLGLLWRRGLLSGAPLLLVASRRPQPDSGWWESIRRDGALAGDESTSTITLEPLSAEAVGSLALAELASTDLPEDLGSWLHERSGGSPLHTLELLRMLVSGGSLQRLGATWQFRPPPDSVVPVGLEATLVGRLKTASADGELWRALAALAIAERPLSLAEWRDLSGSDGERLAERAAEATRVGLTRSELRGGEARYALAHPLYPPLVLSLLEAKHREMLHGRWAEITPDVHERARHARLAQHHKAIVWSWEALESARANGEHRLAAAHISALLERAPAPARRRRLELWLGEALYTLGEYEGAERALSDSDAAEAYRYRAQILRQRGMFAEALALVREALGSRAIRGESQTVLKVVEAGALLQLGRLDEGEALIDELVGDPGISSRERAMALLQKGRLEFMTGRLEEALSSNVQANTVFERTGDEAWAANSLDNIGMLATQLGRWRQAEEALQRSLASYEARGRLMELGTIYNNLGLHRLNRGDYRAAEAVLLRGLRVAQATQDRLSLATLLHNLAQVSAAMGDLEQARRQIGDAIEVQRDVGQVADVAAALLIAAEIAALGGRDAEAMSNLVAAGTAATLDEGPVVAARVQLLLGDLPAAKAALEAPATGNLRPAARARQALAAGLVSLVEGDLAAATAALGRGEILARRDEHEPLGAEIGLAQAVVAELAGERDRAHDLGRESLSRFEKLGARGHVLTLRRLFPRLEVLRPVAAAPTSEPEVSRPFLRALGSFSLEADGTTRPWRARKVRELLALLLAASLREEPPPTAGSIRSALWPDASTTNAEASLRSTVRRLRVAFGDPRVVGRDANGAYVLGELSSDVGRFLAALDQGDVDGALPWYGGEFLPGVELTGVEVVRERLRTRFRDAVWRAAASRPDRAAAELYQGLHDDDPFDLPTLTALVRALRAAGLEGRARRTLARSRAHFLQELGEWPRELSELLDGDEMGSGARGS